MERDAWVFIGVFFFIFLIWIVIGNPFRAPSVQTPKIPDISISTSTTGVLSPAKSYLQLPRSPYVVGGGSVCLPGSTSCPSTPLGGGYGSGSGDLTSGVPGVLLNPTSDYHNAISIQNYVWNASSSDPKSEYVKVSLAQSASTPVDITGWTLGSGATGKSGRIPRGTKVPASGIVNAAEDIILQPGESALIISGESPVGASFRENKCIGYFGSFQDFYPSLPHNCPSASSELSSSYGKPYIHDPACIDYTNSLSRCEAAVVPKSTKLTINCQDFLETHLNYNSCLKLHQSDSDFNGTTWRVYLGRKSLQEARRTSAFSNTLSQDAGPLWRSKYEVVELLDNSGNTVATFNY